MYGRVLHAGAPFVHCGRPALADAVGRGDDVGGVEARELRLVGRRRGHAPEEAAFRVGLVGRDVERALRGVQAPDDVEAGLVDGALGLLGVFERHADLVAELGALVLAQLGFRLGEVVLEEVEEGLVVRGGDARVVQHEGAVGDEGVGGFGALGDDGGRRRLLVEVDVEVDDGEVHLVCHGGGVGLLRQEEEVEEERGSWG